MKVDVFALKPPDASTGAPPRAWRISTADGVFWLLQSTSSSRLLRFPSPAAAADDRASGHDGLLARGVSLAVTAEAEAAGRWVRRGADGGRSPSPARDAPA
jgi:hypothetical protein